MKIDDKTQIGIYDDGETNRTIRLWHLDEPFRSQLLLFPEAKRLLGCFIAINREDHSPRVLKMVHESREVLAKLPPETP